MNDVNETSKLAERTISSRKLRAALGTFLTGVTIVAARDPADGVPRGLTANSFTSVSLTPPLVLVCIDLKSASCAAFRTAGHFSVNILAEDQRALAASFAVRGAEKFVNVPQRSGVTGAPLLEGALSWLECETHQAFEAGDHLVLMGKVIDFDHSAGAPLGFFRGSFANVRDAS
jgi:flavin-dependent trigonelline monooxygenase, reductase component